MAKTRSHRRTRSGGVILALATVGAAQKYTLDAFDPLSATAIPAACRAAYAAPLEGCRRSDFTDDNVCSPSCVQSVDEMEASIQTNCGGVLLPVDTLLAQALLGNLRELLCPGAPNPPPRETSVIRPPLPSTIPPRSTRLPTPVIPTGAPTPDLSTIIQPGNPTQPANPSQPSNSPSRPPNSPPGTRPGQPTTTFSSLTTVVVTEIVPGSTTIPVILTPTPVPTPTIAVPPNPPSGNNGGNNGGNGGGGGSGPGGNDILNPLPGASWTLLPRLDLMLAAALVSFVLL